MLQIEKKLAVQRRRYGLKKESDRWRGQARVTTGVALPPWRAREGTEVRHGCRLTALGKIFGAGNVAVTFTLPE